MTLPRLLQIAGVLHLGLLAAGACLPRVLDFRGHLAGLPPLLRRLFRVYWAFIGGTIIGFGAISFFCADELAAGGPLARALLGLMCLFWTARFAVGLFVFDLRPYLTSAWRRAGYHALDLVFLYLPIVYALAWWRDGH